MKPIDWRKKANPQLELLLDVRTKDDKSKKYIYESPDGGKTIYRREFGEYDPEKRTRMECRRK